jgi:hypothetical protein
MAIGRFYDLSVEREEFLQVRCRSLRPPVILSTRGRVEDLFQAPIGSQSRYIHLFQVKCHHMTDFLCGRPHGITWAKHE